ncbi:MAG: hypothetical protein PHW08_07640 [Kiritimatiellae bacterium]|nr:hypothetical protein [Kiritimatiellia bacterium]
MSAIVTLEYLEDERIKIWGRIEALENLHAKFNTLLTEVEDKCSKDDLAKVASDFAQRLPEHEQEAKTASKMIAEYRNKCKSRADEVEAASRKVVEYETRLSELSSQFNTLQKLQEEANSLLKQIHTVRDTIATQADIANTSLERLENAQTGANQKLQEIEEGCEAWRSLEKTVLSSVKPKIEAQLENAAKDASEIRKAYESILGNAGLKEKFEKNLETFQRYFSSQQREARKSLGDITAELERLDEEASGRYEKLFQEHESTYTSLKSKIEGLLPNALTAGLASAYQEKRIKEVEERDSAQQTFLRSIVAMSILALLPVAFNGWLLFKHNNAIEELIANFPFTVVLILPLYAPALWLAYAANKRVNQSKRLIEEYSHKEALSKTFEGLSTQIKQLEDSGLSGDLSVKLLYNIIKASAENPGELIKGFNKPDNPLVDVLDKTVACTESLNKLAQVPGFKKIASYFSKVSARKTTKIKNDVDEEVASGLSTQEDE